MNRLTRLRLLLVSAVAVAVASCGDAAGPGGVARVDVGLGRDTMIVGEVGLAVAVPRDGSGVRVPDESVSWSSSNEQVATVSSTGLVRALAPGAATIEATAGGRTGSSQLTVRSVAALVRIVTRTGLVDTIEAAAGLPITVQLLDSAGRPRANAAVHFDVPQPDDPRRAENYGVGIAIPDSVSSNAEGIASTVLHLGAISGTWWLYVVDRSTGARDSVAFTSLPGNATNLVPTPLDSAVYVGRSYRQGATAQDRRGNARSDPIGLAVDSGASAVTLADDGTLTGVAFGRARITMQIVGGTITRSARVSVVPSGVLAVSTSAGLGITNLDGSGRRTILSDGSYGFPDWSPDGKTIAFNSANLWSARLFSADLDGNVSLLSRAGTPGSQLWPRYSPDGVYVYYTGGHYGDSLDTFRMRVDGSGVVERVTPPRPGSTQYWHASPSPDGSLLAYSNAAYEVMIEDLATGATRVVDSTHAGDAPQFSPDGARLLFGDAPNNALHLINVDGSGYRRLTPPTVRADQWAHAWSSDGAWVVFRAANDLELVRVSDGLIVPLPYSGDMTDPAWRP